MDERDTKLEFTHQNLMINHSDTAKEHAIPNKTSKKVIIAAGIGLLLLCFAISVGGHFAASSLSSDDDDAGKPPPIITAAREGFVEDIEALIKDGAAVNAVDDNKNGETALMAAARRNRADIVDALIQAGADFDAVTRGEPPERYQTAMDLASDRIKPVMKALIDGHFDNNYVKALELACFGDNGHFRLGLVKRLLSSGRVHPNTRFQGGWCMLMEAVYSDSGTDLVELLLKEGASVNWLYKNWKGEMKTSLDYGGEKYRDILLAYGGKHGSELEL